MKTWKIRITLFVFIILGISIMARLAYFQILKHDYYMALAQGQQRRFQPMTGERGEIFFKGGQVLATNVESKYLTITLKEVENLEQTSEIISEV